MGSNLPQFPAISAIRQQGVKSTLMLTRQSQESALSRNEIILSVAALPLIYVPPCSKMHQQGISPGLTISKLFQQLPGGRLVRQRCRGIRIPLDSCFASCLPLFPVPWVPLLLLQPWCDRNSCCVYVHTSVECACLNAGSVSSNTHLSGPKLQRSHDETTERARRIQICHQGQALVFQDFIIQNTPFKGFNSDSAF